MPYQSDHAYLSLSEGLATLTLRVPGRPVNPLGVRVLQEVAAALDAVAANPSADVLVVRGRPEGFCGGFDPAELADCRSAGDFAAFCRAGQDVFDRLRRLPAVTLACLDGPCRGPGLELALACDHRFAVVRPTTALGPDPSGLGACWGTAALPGRDLSPRAALAAGWVDRAVSPRQAKVHLWGFALELQRRGAKPARRAGACQAAVRGRFITSALGMRDRLRRRGEALGRGLPQPWRVPPPVRVVALAGHDPAAVELAAGAAAAGGRVVPVGVDPAPVKVCLDAYAAGGWLTPLDAEQAFGRVGGDPWDADLLLDPTPAAAAACPAAVPLVFGDARGGGRAVRLGGDGTLAGDDPVGLHAVAAWLGALGREWVYEGPRPAVTRSRAA